MASMYRSLRELSGATSLSSTNSELDKYSALWNEFWGSDDAQARHFQTCTIQRDGTLPDLDVPSEVAILHAASVSSLHDGQGPILIRPEFVEALKALLQFAEDNPSSIPCVFYDILEDQEAIPACSGAWPSAQDETPFLTHITTNQHIAFVLQGQPDIGKTLWIIYVLCLRLQAKKVTIFEDTPGVVIVFNEEGAFAVEYDHKCSPKVIDSYVPKDAWCFVDCNRDLVDVPSFLSCSGRLIVQSAPPRVEHIKWTSKHSTEVVFFVMKPWTLDELTAGYLSSAFEHGLTKTFT